MIRCEKCGTLNEADASFCSQCDAFLEWSGAHVEENVEQTGTQSDEAPARSDLPPSANPETGPQARKPAKGETTPVRKAKPQPPSAPERPKPGQFVCATCGTGNDRDRKFCRRCGTAMDVALAEAPPPRTESRRRWSWLTGAARRGRQKAYIAGQRPDSMLSTGARWRPGSTMMVFGLLGIIGLGGIASYLYMPGVSDAVDDMARTVQRRFLRPEEVRAIAAQGQAHPEFPATNLIDGSGNSYWVGSRNRNDRWVVDFEFQRPADLLQVNFDSGADGAAYERLGRPYRFRLKANDETSSVYELRDTPDQQPVDIDLPGVKSLRLIVLSRYRGSDSDDEIAIREVKFFEDAN